MGDAGLGRERDIDEGLPECHAEDRKSGTGRSFIPRALISLPSRTFDDVSANPPIGKNSPTRFTDAGGAPATEELTRNRKDFRARTSKGR